MNSFIFHTDDINDPYKLRRIDIVLEEYDMIFEGVFTSSLSGTKQMLGKLSYDGFNKAWTVFLNREHCTETLYHIDGFKTKKLAIEFILKMNGVRIP
jgi:hypothetical protein